jgi:hypothetical protein
MGIGRRLTLILILFLTPSLLLSLKPNFLLDKPYAYATDRLPGVAKNQFLQYELRAFWINGGGNDTAYIYASSIPFVWYYNITVLGVNGSLVALHWVTYNLTSTLTDEIDVFDVESGELMNFTNPSGFFPLLIASNLNVGDLAYNGTGLPWDRIINGTVTKALLGTQMQTNHLNDYLVTTRYMGGAPYNLSVQSDYYWEIVTGVLAEHVEYQNTNRSALDGGWLVSTAEVEIQILSAVPTIPESPSFIILPLFMLTTLLVVVACKRKLYRRSSIE